MHYYVIIDKKTGTIVGTHAKYVLGSEEPVACSDKEIIQMFKDEHPGAQLTVQKAPEDFDVRKRGKRLSLDKKSGKVKVTVRPRPAKKK